MFDESTQPSELELKARLAAIVESSDDAIVSKTLNGVITSWNKGAERIFGYTAEEIIGKPMTTIFPPDRFDEETEILRRLKEGNRVDHFETVRLTKDGRFVDISVTISPVRDAAGRIIGASKIARDITQQKRIERELRRARDEAEAANLAKDHFLSILSHELRTPLTPVLAAISMIEAGANLTPDELRRHLSMIRRNVETQARLVDDLLDITRISRGKIHLNLETVDVHAAIRNVVAMLQTEIDAKRLKVTLAPTAAAYHVSADAGRFQQILLNLLSNAVKFTPVEGAVTIRSLNENGSIHDVKVEVVDSGIGIDAETLPRLFQPFEQGERTITRRFGGLGLGLSIVRSLVELHGGSISAASAGPGQGATFSFRMETVAPPSVDRPRSRVDWSCVEGKRLRVLLVEDHGDTREMMKLLLASFGCEVTTAASAHDAFEWVDARDFDLLISDIGLPDGSGLDVMRHANGRRHVRGIALSGFGQDDDLRRSREAGFDRHLTKPVNMESLAAAIQAFAQCEN